MAVGLEKTGQDGAPTQVDDLCSGTHPSPHAGAIAHQQDPASSDGQALADGQPVVHGDASPVQQYQVSVHFQWEPPREGV
jgi:hypothetical protein